jgi:hypothetical protein
MKPRLLLDRLLMKPRLLLDRLLMKLKQAARLAADNAIMATAATNKSAADLTAERLAELYLYFNQTYASVILTITL